jgi:hypothetical protein
MSIPPQNRVPHLRDGLIVAKVGIVRSTNAPAHFHTGEPCKAESKS